MPFDRNIDDVYAIYLIILSSTLRFGSGGMMPKGNSQEPLLQALRTVRYGRFARQSRVKLGGVVRSGENRVRRDFYGLYEEFLHVFISHAGSVIFLILTEARGCAGLYHYGIGSFHEALWRLALQM